MSRSVWRCSRCAELSSGCWCFRVGPGAGCRLSLEDVRCSLTGIGLNFPSLPAPGSVLVLTVTAMLPQEEADAAAAQRSLQQVLGLPTSLQRLPAAGLLADAGRRGWGAALYASSNGGLGAALGAVEDAALQQQLLDEMRSMRQDMAEVAEGLGEDDGVLLTPGGGGDRAPDAAELLLAVLQQQAVVLGSEVVQDAASLAAAADARAVAAAAEAEAVAECEAEAAAAASAAAAAQQQQQPPAPQQQQAAVADAPPAAGEPAARPAAAGSSGAASWDPTAEKLPQRRSDPDWWLSLPVLHCPQLLYADGSKGLMSVRCSLPMFVGSTVVAGQGLSGDGSGGTGGNSGGGGGGGATAARMSEMRLIAFAEASDAEALADCPVQVGGWGWAGVGAFPTGGRGGGCRPWLWAMQAKRWRPSVPCAWLTPSAACSSPCAGPHQPHCHPDPQRAARAAAQAC